MNPVTDHLVPVPSERLGLGMYVAELDRSWLHTPFETRGFLITQASQVDILRRACEYVYIDPNRSDALAMLEMKDPNAGPLEMDNANVRPEPLDLCGCREVLQDARAQIAGTIRAARRAGRLEIEPFARSIDEFVEQVLEWPDEAQWLLTAEPARGYLNRRSLGTAVYTIVFGRHLGLNHDALRELALGAMLLDIGKTAVPITILSKPKRLNSVELSFARRHVDRSVTLVRLNARMAQRIVDMVAGHHERLDGSGYPHHIGGTEISLYARIAGIADTFDALTQNRGYANGRSGHAALRHLNTRRNVKFDAALIDEFVHAIGVYPVGTNVELADGSIGIVCRQKPGEPTRPDVLLKRDADGRALDSPQVAESTPTRRVRRALPNIVALN
jgi:hypothetical protein